MHARIVSMSLFLAGLVMAASPAAFGQRGGGHGGGMMGGGMGGAMGGGSLSEMQRGGGALDRVPVERHSGSVLERDEGASSDHPGSEHAAKTPGELLKQNTKLADNLAKLLPAGTDLQAAASGFKNLGEFVAAVHVSHNLGIPFADLKTKMMAGDSLGQAIGALRPDADAQVEVRKARARAEQDIAKG